MKLEKEFVNLVETKDNIENWARFTLSLVDFLSTLKLNPKPQIISPYWEQILEAEKKKEEEEKAKSKGSSA